MTLSHCSIQILLFFCLFCLNITKVSGNVCFCCFRKIKKIVCQCGCGCAYEHCCHTQYPGVSHKAFIRQGWNMSVLQCVFFRVGVCIFVLYPILSWKIIAIYEFLSVCVCTPATTHKSRCEMWSALGCMCVWVGGWGRVAVERWQSFEQTERRHSPDWRPLGPRLHWINDRAVGQVHVMLIN